MPPMLATLSVRRLQGSDATGAAASSAVFFVKVGPHHTVSVLQETLRKLFGLAADAKVPLFFNGAELNISVLLTEAGVHTGAVIETALDDDSFGRCISSAHNGVLVDLDDYNLSRSMTNL